ncbi:hypothetical protein GCM10009737_08320 [Nocardioides lentus]|uniref:Uncharacterized protein n=1 Tax=Nocardioides lentus TaxID=338077 RepID=A0ABN2P511_9ACTN
MSLTMHEPEGFPVLATAKVAAVLTFAAPEAPKLAEINVASSVDLSLFLRGLPAEISTNTGMRPSGMGSSVDLGRGGRTQIPAFTVRYPFNPQDPDDSTPDNKAKGLLKRGTRLWLAVRKGIDADQPFAADDVLEMWKVKCEEQTRPNDGDEFADNEIQQVLTPLRRPIYDVVLVSA